MSRHASIEQAATTLTNLRSAQSCRDRDKNQDKPPPRRAGIAHGVVNPYRAAYRGAVVNPYARSLTSAALTSAALTSAAYGNPYATTAALTAGYNPYANAALTSAALTGAALTNPYATSAALATGAYGVGVGLGAGVAVASSLFPVNLVSVWGLFASGWIRNQLFEGGLAFAVIDIPDSFVDAQLAALSGEAITVRSLCPVFVSQISYTAGAFQLAGTVRGLVIILPFVVPRGVVPAVGFGTPAPIGVTAVVGGSVSPEIVAVGLNNPNAAIDEAQSAAQLFVYPFATVASSFIVQF